MATSKEYAYFLKGNKLAIVQKDYTFSGGLNYTYDDDGLGIGTGGGLWKSPKEDATNGLEIEYAYSPIYNIESVAAADKETVVSYETSDGFLRLNGVGFSTESTVDYIVIRGSARWNGLHKVTGLNTAHYTLATKYNGINVTEGSTVYTDIDIINDESDTIPVSDYLSKAVVLYVKAQMAEDEGDPEKKEYFMKQFRKKIEQQESARIYGPRIVSPGFNAIR